MKTSSRQENGFTLLEILVTLFIFGVIASTLFLTYRALFFDTKQFAQTTRRFAQAQVCIQRILTDLRTIRVTPAPLYTVPQDDASPDPFRLVGQTGFVGDAAFSSLRFTSTAHLTLDNSHQTGIAAIRYYVANSAEQSFTLRRSDRLQAFVKEDPDGADPILCEEVQSFRITYYDQAGEPYDRWDSDSGDYAFATPAVIELELEIGDVNDTLVFKTQIKLPVYREASASL